MKNLISIEEAREYLLKRLELEASKFNCIFCSDTGTVYQVVNWSKFVSDFENSIKPVPCRHHSRG